MPNISNIIKILQITEQVVSHEPWISADNGFVYLPIDKNDIEKNPELYAELQKLGCVYEEEYDCLKFWV